MNYSDRDQQSFYQPEPALLDIASGSIAGDQGDQGDQLLLPEETAPAEAEFVINPSEAPTVIQVQRLSTKKRYSTKNVNSFSNTNS